MSAEAPPTPPAWMPTPSSGGRPSREEDTNSLVRRAADLGRLGAWSWEAGATRAHCSREACRILGLHPGCDPRPARALACFAPEHRPLLLDAFLSCARAGSPFDVEAQVVHGPHLRTWVRVIAEPEWDEHGEVVRMQGAVQDVTPAKRVQEELVESRRELAALMDNLPGMAYRCLNSPRWPLLFVSDRCVELTGYLPGELAARRPNYGDLIHPEDAERVWARVQEALRQHRRFNVTYRIRSRDGQLKWVWEQGTGVTGADGRQLVEGLILDVSFAKRIEAELNTLNQTLEDRVRERTSQLVEANAELEALAYSIAHDLRAPMTAVAGYAKVLEESLPGLEGRSAHFLRRIMDNVGRMSEMTDALLSLARLPGVEVAPDEVDLGELATKALEPLREQEPQRRLVFHVHPGLRARGDRRLLQQVMANLVGNAWKFSRTREVTTIEVGRTARRSGRDVFFVRDEGVGFDMAHAAHLFGAFRRLHAAAEFEGTGIGLALVRKIVQRHGGQVWAQAEPGRGATIFFSLPVGPAAGTHAPGGIPG